MQPAELALPESLETGTIPVYHLKRLWSKAIARKRGELAAEALQSEWNLDSTLLSTLGLGLEQTMIYLYQYSTSFADFEQWIIETNGGAIDTKRTDAFNQIILNAGVQAPSEQADVLSEDDLTFWKENGYVIIREAVNREDSLAAEKCIWEFLEMDANDPATWYKPHEHKQGIMVQLFQHEALAKNRQSPRIRKAYEQLWSRSDLWVSNDRAGFNPPETSDWKFPGPRLHWDVSLEPPIPFGTQGILYLTDTLPEQGALTIVPGFQNRIEEWLRGLPSNVNPRNEDIYALGTKAIGANAGDFIIWHQSLPHGSSPNRATLPRIVQYINWQPADPEVRKNWK